MIHKIVSNSWFREVGLRLDCNPYIHGAFEARDALRALDENTQPLIQLTCGYRGGIYNGPVFSRKYVENSEQGVPFLTASSMMRVDLSDTAYISKRDAYSKKLSYLKLEPGMIMISCSGSIGKMVYVRPDMEGFWSCQDQLKVCADEAKIGSGYLYAFLNSRFGVPLITSGTYGAIIQHLEPEHIANIPVPRLGQELEEAIDKSIKEASICMAKFQAHLNKATNIILEVCGLKDFTFEKWHEKGPDLGFRVNSINRCRSLRALNYNPRYKDLIRRLNLSDYLTLGQITASGELSRGLRFKRVDADKTHGVKLVGQKQAFWQRPEGRDVSRAFTPPGVIVEDNTLLISSQGTLGERSIFCKPVLVKGKWSGYAFTEHFMRVRSAIESIPNQYLFAFLRSEAAYRCLWSMSMGSAQQDINLDMLRDLPVPVLPKNQIDKVVQLVDEAFDLRDRADELELSAIEKLENRIEQLAKG